MQCEYTSLLPQLPQEDRYEEYTGFHFSPYCGLLPTPEVLKTGDVSVGTSLCGVRLIAARKRLGEVVGTDGAGEAPAPNSVGRYLYGRIEGATAGTDGALGFAGVGGVVGAGGAAGTDGAERWSGRGALD